MSNINQDLSLKVPLNHEFSLDTKASYFLPTRTGDGLVCYAMFHYLSSIQNEMLDFYESNKITRDSDDDDDDDDNDANRSTASASGVASSQPIENFDNTSNLILFDKNGDLMRIVQANFSYDSKNLAYLFRYEAIEHQLIDRFMRNKPRVDKSTLFVFEYSDELGDASAGASVIAVSETATTTSIFARLNDSCAQETLPWRDAQEIMAQFEHVADLSETLNTLKVVINYAIATQAGADVDLAEFVQRIYGIAATTTTTTTTTTITTTSGDNDDQAISSSQQERNMNAVKSILKSSIVHLGSRLKHLKHIWIILMLKRAILHTINEQDPFDALNINFKRPLGHGGESATLPKYAYEPAVINSVLLVVYQIIYFVLMPLNGDDLQTYPTISIRDTFDLLDDLKSVLLVDEAIVRLLPASFPDRGSDYNPNMHAQEEEEEEKVQEVPKLRMSSVYEIWRQLCQQYNLIMNKKN